MRHGFALLLTVGAVLAAAGCGSGDGGGGGDTASGDSLPEGFTEDEIGGVVFGYPDSWAEHPVEPVPDNWAFQYEVPEGDLFVASFGVFTGLQDSGDASTNALIFLDTFRNEQGGFDSLSHDDEVEVPGAEQAHRADYTFQIIEDDGTERTVQGADLTVQAQDGTRTALRLNVLEGEVPEGLIEDVLGTVHLP